MTDPRPQEWPPFEDKVGWILYALDLPADADARAVRSPRGYVHQPETLLDQFGEELGVDLPAAGIYTRSESYAVVEYLPVPGFRTAGELAQWLHEERFLELLEVLVDGYEYDHDHDDSTFGDVGNAALRDWLARVQARIAVHNEVTDPPADW